MAATEPPPEPPAATESRQTALILCIVAAWIGVAVSLVLTWQHAHPLARSVCGPGSGCEQALRSDYSEVLGIPLAALGLILHGSSLVIHLLLYGFPDRPVAAPLHRFVRALLLVGTLASGVLLYVQFGVLRTLCVLCTISAAMVILQYFTTVRVHLGPSEAKQRARAGWLTVGLIAGLLVGSIGFVLGRRPQIVARFDGTEITAETMRMEMSLIHHDLEMQTYESERAWIENKLGEMAVAAEARRRGITPARLLELEVEDGIEVSETEIDAWLKKQRTTFSEQERRARVARSIRAHKRKERRQGLLLQLLAEHETAVLLEPPAVHTVELDTTGADREGPAEAAVRLVVFSEFRCPHCAALGGTLRRIRERHPKEVSVTFLHFPIQDHEHSEAAAVAAACAGEQGRFDAFHDRLFAPDAALDEQGLVDHARALGLDLAKFASCRTSGQTLERVRANARQARALGIQTVPTLFLNGRRIGGAISYESLEQLVARSLGGPWSDLAGGGG